MINRALNAVVIPTQSDADVEEYGFIPALLALGAAVAPSLMNASTAGKDAKAQKRTLAAQQVVANRQKQADAKKRQTWLLVGGGAGLLVVVGLGIYIATRKRSKR